MDFFNFCWVFQKFPFFLCHPVSRAVLRMRNVSDKSCTENQNTHFVFSNFFVENRAVYEIVWKNVVERGRRQVTVWRMRIAWWILKATNTRSEYVILLLHCTNGYTNAPLFNVSVHGLLVLKVPLQSQTDCCVHPRSAHSVISTACGNNNDHVAS